MEERLVAPGQRGPHALALRRRVPVRGRGDRSVVGGEADQEGVATVALAHELADVELAARPHLGAARVAEVRVVRPHDRALVAAVAVEVRQQPVERLGHVAVAQVPGRLGAAEHRAVVLLGVLHEPRVLLGVELLVLGG